MFFRRTAARWIAFAAALVTVSCAKPISRTDSGDPSARPERPAEIQLPAEGATTNLDSLRAYLDTFYMSPLHRHIVAAICAKSGTAGCTDSVTIRAIGLSKDIKADSGPARGRVIGQIRNLDPRDLTEMDSLKPASQFSYYIYVDKAANGRARWNLLEVPVASRGSIRRIVQKEFRACGEKPGYVWRHSDVDFANCGEHAFTDMQLARALTATGLIDFFVRLERFIRAKTSILPQSKWVGCPGGCCN